ncbi:MAG: hypothetical protein Q9200_004555 [Gallowayella weberi]
MNHEPSPSSSEYTSSPRLLSDYDPSLSSPQAAPAPAIEHDDPIQLSQQVSETYKIHLLNHLIRQFDIMIYCHISVLYYLDCSMTLFFARVTNHWYYFTPKPALMNPVVSSSRPNIVAIIFLNVVSMFIHYTKSQTSAGEGMRGYLHGSLLIDFVGQKSPVSRTRLLAFDALVLGLQLVMLALIVERRNPVGPSGTSSDSTSSGEIAPQDHNSEERGMRRSEEGTEVIELRPLQPVSERREGGEGQDPLGDLKSTTKEHPGDAFYSGQYIIVHVHMIDTIQHHWRQVYANANEFPSHNSIGPAADTDMSRRRLGLRMRMNERGYRSWETRA